MSLTAPSAASLSIAIAGDTQTQSDFRVAAGNNVRIELPERFSAGHVATAAQDAALIQRLFTEKAAEVEEMLALVVAGDLPAARKIAAEIGFAEDSFVQQGGGIWALVIGLAIGCAVLLAHD